MAIAKNIKPTTKNSPAIKVGANRNNKPAESYDKRGTGAAAEKASTGHGMKDPNTMSSQEETTQTPARRVSIGKIDGTPKTSGIKMRGTGAATKGTMSRGPMA